MVDRVGRGQRQRQRAVDERAVERDVDVVEAVAQDRDADRERERREADADQREPRLQVARRPDQPGAHVERGDRGDRRAHGENELELLQLVAVRPPQPDEGRRGAQPHHRDRQHPGDDVGGEQRAAAARDPERVRQRVERDVERAGPQGAGEHEAGQRAPAQVAAERQRGEGRRPSGKYRSARPSSGAVGSETGFHSHTRRRGGGEEAAARDAIGAIGVDQLPESGRNADREEDPADGVVRDADGDDRADRREAQPHQHEREPADAAEQVLGDRPRTAPEQQATVGTAASTVMAQAAIARRMWRDCLPRARRGATVRATDSG